MLLTLDVGCGGSKRYSWHIIRGDINIDILKPTYKIANFIQCDAHHLPFRTGVFDKIYMYDLIEHLDSPLLALREAHRVLKPGGLLELGTPNALYILKIARAAKRGFYTPHEDHIATWGLPELTNLLRKAGFKEIRVYYTTYLDDKHKFLERFILRVLPFKALKHRQLKAFARK
jgi:SAM-dependent methyltransferase